MRNLWRYGVTMGLATLVMVVVLRLSFSPPAPVPDEIVALSTGNQLPALTLVSAANPGPGSMTPAISPTTPQASPTPATPRPTITTASPTPSQATACLPPDPMPRWLTVPIHPTNFGERFSQDASGRPVSNPYIIVLHETVSSGLAAINTFRTPHPRDEDQVSYHDLILLDGTIVHLVPWEKRAYGAGNSEFRGEAVQTNPKFPSSVNNFALHFSLETPPGAYHNGPQHRGYTAAQYRSLAWLVAYTQIPDDRVTTHKAVDRASGKQDPRSFDTRQFQSLLNQLRPNC